MSADQDFEREWEQAKSELRKLKGCRVYPVARPTNSTEILSIDDQRGIHVRRKNDSWIKWEQIKDAYGELYRSGELRAKSSAKEARIGYGAFCRALFVKLTTAKRDKDGRSTILRYEREGRPPRLKDGHALQEPNR